jgi:hypothetical protein
MRWPLGTEWRSDTPAVNGQPVYPEVKVNEVTLTEWIQKDVDSEPKVADDQ